MRILLLVSVLLVTGCAEEHMPRDASADSSRSHDSANANDFGAVDGANRDSAVLDALDMGRRDSGTDTDVEDAGPRMFEAEAELICDGQVSQAERCSTSASDGCLDNMRCIVRFLRHDVVGTVAECFRNRPCTGVGSDSCVNATYLGVTPTPVALAYQTRCLERQNECDNGFNDDFCELGMGHDDLIRGADACLDENCGEVSTCFRALESSLCP